jgi:hypothetical protein
MAGTTFADELMEAARSRSPALACMNLIAKYQGCRVYIHTQSKADRRARAAAHMLQNAMARGDVAKALRVRFNVSERTAWNDIAKARRYFAEGNCATG